MEKMTIGLDCNKDTCGKCKLIADVYPTGYFKRCAIFGGYLPLVKRKQKANYYRLPECIDACKAQNKAKK